MWKWKRRSRRKRNRKGSRRRLRKSPKKGGILDAGQPERGSKLATGLCGCNQPVLLCIVGLQWGIPDLCCIPMFPRFDEFDEAIEEAIEEDIKEAEGGGETP